MVDIPPDFLYNRESMWIKINRFCREILIYIFIAGLLSFLTLRFVITPYKISGDSMSPTLISGERIFISPAWSRNPRFHRFDIVVLNSRSDSNRLIIKRIVGLPGERLELKAGVLWINHKQLTRTSTSVIFSKKITITPVKISKNNYFVLGDNLPYSRDSRHFGPIESNAIQGKAVFRYWPLSRMGRIE